MSILLFITMNDEYFKWNVFIHFIFNSLIVLLREKMNKYMIIFTNLMIGLAQWADKSSLFRVQFDISIRHSLLCSFLCLLQSVRQVYRIHRASDENEGRWTCQEAPEKHQEEKKDKHNLGSNFCCFLRLMGPSQFVFHII